MRYNRPKIELNRQEFSIAHRPPLLRSINWALQIGAPQRADLQAVGVGQRSVGNRQFAARLGNVASATDIGRNLLGVEDNMKRMANSPR